LLLLVGAAPAAYFSDACRIMGAEPRLVTSTHVVAHLLREVEGCVRQVIRPMVDDALWPEKRADNAAAKQVELMCDALGVAADDELRTLWRDYSGELHWRAHRQGLAAPRPMSQEFVDVWDQAQAVIYTIVRRIEATYARSLPFVEQLASGPPKVKDLRQNVPHSTVVLGRFFELAGREWFPGLRAAGYFSTAPRLAPNEDGTVAFEPWPAGRFIGRWGAAFPDEILELALEIETDNPAAHEAFTTAAFEFPAATAARLVPVLLKWLAGAAQWALPYRAKDLAVHLIRHGETSAGVQLLCGVLTSDDLQRGGMAAHLCSEVVPKVFPAAGIVGVTAFADLLAAQAQRGELGQGDDYSSIWRPSIARDRHGDFRDSLVTALRDACTLTIDEDPNLLAPVLAALASHQFSIHRRIALWLVDRYEAKELAAAFLTDRESFLESNAWLEYSILASKHFPDLADDAKDEIGALIATGPARAADEDAVARWRTRMISMFPPPLPESWGVDSEEAERNWRAPSEDLVLVANAAFVASESPLTVEELGTMSVGAISEFLSTWEAPERVWGGPSPEGLAKNLRQAVVADPSPFAEGADEFRRVDPTYVRAVFGGLREACANGEPFPWEGPVSLAGAIITQPQTIPGRENNLAADLDPSWEWGWQELAHLLREAFSRTGLVPQAAREAAWQVVVRLCGIGHEEVEINVTDAGWASPALSAANSVRGAAIEAALAFVWSGRDTELSPADRRMPDGPRELLERHLDPSVEASLAIHSLYGKWFPRLAAADEHWTAEHLPLIYPVADEQRRRVAFESYVAFNDVWEQSFAMLPDEYRHAIGRLEERTASPDNFLGTPSERLSGHLMAATASGFLSHGDGSQLLEEFCRVATPDQRAECVDFIGRALMNGEQNTEMLVRLQAYWEWRAASVFELGPADLGELAPFAWWFASGKFELSWSMRQLESLLAAGGQLDPQHIVVKRLLDVPDCELTAALGCLEPMVDRPSRPWFVLSAKEAIMELVRRGLAAGGDSMNKARDIANRLVAHGHMEFEAELRDNLAGQLQQQADNA
jgi:hypothetical protein